MKSFFMVAILVLSHVLIPTVTNASPKGVRARVFTGYVNSKLFVGAMVEQESGVIHYFSSNFTKSIETLDASCWYDIEYFERNRLKTVVEIADSDDCGHDFPGDR